MRSLSPSPVRPFPPSSANPNSQHSQASDTRPNLKKPRSGARSNDGDAGKSASVAQPGVARRVTSTSAVKTPSHQRSNSPSAQRIGQALKAQRCPTNKEIRSFCK